MGPRGSLFNVWSPSGGGKSSLVAELQARDPLLRRSISHTTRPPREGEREGREYHFIDRAGFLRMADNGEFVEHAEVYGNLYGTGARWIEATLAQGLDVILTIDWQGAQQLRRLFPAFIGVYVLPPSLEALEERLRARAQDGEAVIARRLASVKDDLSHLADFDYVILNKDFPEAVEDLSVIVRASRLKTARQLAFHRSLIDQLTLR